MQQGVTVPGDTESTWYELSEASQGLPVAFSPRSLDDDEVFAAVDPRFGSVTVDGIRGSGSADYIVELPPTPMTEPTLVSFLVDGGAYFQHRQVDNRKLHVRYEYTVTPHPVSPQMAIAYQCRIYLDGQLIAERSDDASGQPPEFQNVGAVFVNPTLSSTQSGLYTVTSTVNNANGVGNHTLTRSCHQRALVFAEEFPEYDSRSPDPVNIQNRLA